MKTFDRKPVLLFLADTTHPATAVHDHIQAIVSSRDFEWHLVNPLVLKTLDLLDFNMFDGIGLHYSVKPYNHYYISYAFKRKLAAYMGVKFLFLQDEYQKVDCVQDFMATIGFDVFFTLVAEKYWHKAYPDPRLRSMQLVTVLTGYVPDALQNLEVEPIARRPVHVSYRARRCDYWLGKLAFEKQYIGDRFLQLAQHTGLALDISMEEADRCYGQGWFQLLSKSRAVLGSESGASIWDFDGSIRAQTMRFCKKNRDASFDMVYDQVLRPYDGTILYAAVSPRIFEAAATRTAMVLFPGSYSDVCVPDQHYIVLQKDFSNMKEVVSQLRDTAYLQAMVDRTHADLIASGRFHQTVFARTISRHLLDVFHKKGYQAPSALHVERILAEHIKQYPVRNTWRRMLSEGLFVIHNFLALLTDPRYRFTDKLRHLKKGLMRYWAYLLPRFKV